MFTLILQYSLILFDLSSILRPDKKLKKKIMIKKYMTLTLSFMMISSATLAENGYTLGAETIKCSGSFKNCGIEHKGHSSIKKNLMATTKAKAPNRNGKIN